MADDRFDNPRTTGVGGRVDARGEACPTGIGAGFGASPGRVGREPEGTMHAAPQRDTASFTHNGAAQGRSIPQLLRSLTYELSTLVRMEASLAKAEMREKFGIVTRNLVPIAIGGVLALAGTMVLMGAFVGGLSSIMDNAGVSPRIYSWLSPLIVSAVVLGIGYALVMKGINKIKCANLAPEKTVQSLRETGEWAKEKVS